MAIYFDGYKWADTENYTNVQLGICDGHYLFCGSKTHRCHYKTRAWTLLYYSGSKTQKFELYTQCKQIAEKHRNFLLVLCEINKKMIVQIKNLINLTKERTIKIRMKNK